MRLGEYAHAEEAKLVPRATLSVCGFRLESATDQKARAAERVRCEVRLLIYEAFEIFSDGSGLPFRFGPIGFLWRNTVITTGIGFQDATGPFGSFGAS